jgi:hypothetical protein
MRKRRYVETIEAITIERMLQLLKEAGLEPEPLMTLGKKIDHPPVVAWERHEVTTIMELQDDSAGDRRYSTVVFSAEMPADGRLWEFWYEARELLPRDVPKVRLEQTFTLAGVSLDWLQLQIRQWDRRVFLERLAVQSRFPEPDVEVVH